MQASLYQFLPDAEAICAACAPPRARSVIVAEPVRNLASSRLGIVARLGARRRRDGAARRPSASTPARCAR